MIPLRMWPLILGALLMACGGDDTDAPPAEAPPADEPPADAPPADEPPADEPPVDPDACDAEPVIRTTAEGLEFVRTPDSCFADLPGWPYAPQYVEIDGLRQAYVDEGPADGPVVLLLHGQPSWSYLYRKMIPVLADAGFRVIAMDHLGMGRSDKPIEIDAYSYLGHNARLEQLIEALNLRDINLFVQDWGSLIGLRVAGLNPDWFARIAVGNGFLPVIPEGFEPFPPPEDPDQIIDIPSTFEGIPAQQVPFYDGCELLLDTDESGGFGAWIEYAMKARSFRASEVIEALTWFDLPDDVEAAYDAPFPSRVYMGGPRTFPSLVNQVPGTTAEAWAGLTAFERPFLTIWAANDPGNLGQCDTQQRLIDNVPGAAGLPHDRLPEASHFLQDDQGPEIARRLASFFSLVPFGPGSRYCELLLVSMVDGALEAEVWGTQGVDTCAPEGIEALDLDAIQAETGALAAVLNGPRHWLPSVSGSPAGGALRTFGDMRMRRLAVVEIDGAMGEDMPYIERTVRRTTTYVFAAGGQVFELVAPDGSIYAMQSLSLMVDPELTLDDLPTLGDRLELPEGWTYRARSLDEDLIMSVEGQATVLTDSLTNTYQKR